MVKRPSSPSIDVQIQNFEEIIKTESTYKIVDLLKAHFAQQVQLTDEEIRAAVKKIIEIAHGYEILEVFNLLKDQGFRLTDEEIGVAVQEFARKEYGYWIFELLKFLKAQGVQLKDEQIRAVVGRAIRVADTYWILKLLKSHFTQEVKLTDEEIGAAIGKSLYRFKFDSRFLHQEDLTRIMQIVNDYFPKLTRAQIVIFAEGTSSRKMIPFLIRYSQELDLDRFQWIVEASPPLCIRSFWEKCPATLSQEKLIILKKKIDIKCQKITSF
jgi:hypothetical protein